METYTTAASCLNIDVKTFNPHGNAISMRKTNEIQVAKKSYAVIKKTTQQTKNVSQRPKSGQRKVT